MQVSVTQNPSVNSKYINVDKELFLDYKETIIEIGKTLRRTQKAFHDNYLPNMQKINLPGHLRVVNKAFKCSGYKIYAKFAFSNVDAILISPEIISGLLKDALDLYDRLRNNAETIRNIINNFENNNNNLVPDSNTSKVDNNISSLDPTNNNSTSKPSSSNDKNNENHVNNKPSQNITTTNRPNNVVLDENDDDVVILDEELDDSVYLEEIDDFSPSDNNQFNNNWSDNQGDYFFPSDNNISNNPNYPSTVDPLNPIPTIPIDPITPNNPIDSNPPVSEDNTLPHITFVNVGPSEVVMQATAVGGGVISGLGSGSSNIGAINKPEFNNPVDNNQKAPQIDYKVNEMEFFNPAENDERFLAADNESPELFDNEISENNINENIDTPLENNPIDNLETNNTEDQDVLGSDPDDGFFKAAGSMGIGLAGVAGMGLSFNNKNNPKEKEDE